MATNYASGDSNLPDTVKDWIDARVSGAGKSIYRGTLDVLASGFGKGLLIAAAIAATGILLGAIFAPGLMFGQEFAHITVAKAIDYAVPTIGNFLLGSGKGLAFLAVGGATGSLVAAHGENTRIGKDAALAQAAHFAQIREENSKAVQPLIMQETQHASPQPNHGKEEKEAKEGYCAKLMREQRAQKSCEQCTVSR